MTSSPGFRSSRSIRNVLTWHIPRAKDASHHSLRHRPRFPMRSHLLFPFFSPRANGPSQLRRHTIRPVRFILALHRLHPTITAKERQGRPAGSSVNAGRDGLMSKRTSRRSVPALPTSVFHTSESGMVSEASIHPIAKKPPGSDTGRLSYRFDLRPGLRPWPRSASCWPPSVQGSAG